MANIVIKKKVSLDFLGDEYKESYILFKAIPLLDYEKLMDELPSGDFRLSQLIDKQKSNPLSDEEMLELKELQQLNIKKNKDSFKIIIKVLKDYFIAGKFPNENGELEDLNDKNSLDGLDKESAVTCFTILTGQESDPKGGEN